MEFSNEKPIYLQIAEDISEKILSGEFKPSERIPSVREWAEKIGVNPNTVARTYDTLSGRGVLTNQRGIGFFVAQDAVRIITENEKERFINEDLPIFVKKAALLGIDLKDYLK